MSDEEKKWFDPVGCLLQIIVVGGIAAFIASQYGYFETKKDLEVAVVDAEQSETKKEETQVPDSEWNVDLDRTKEAYDEIRGYKEKYDQLKGYKEKYENLKKHVASKNEKKKCTSGYFRIKYAIVPEKREDGRDWDGDGSKPDPFVWISTGGGNTDRTPTIQDDVRGEFRCEIVVNAGDRLQIKVYDEDVVADDIIGIKWLDISQEKIDTWIRQNKEGMTQYTEPGKCSVGLEFIPIW